jgi:DNA-directed RNA polymerase specialized sigma24 family protein
VGGFDPAAALGSLDPREALERLDSDDRALLAMRYLAWFDATELSAATGITRQAHTIASSDCRRD